MHIGIARKEMKEKNNGDLLCPGSDLFEKLLHRDGFGSSYIFQRRTGMSIE